MALQSLSLSVDTRSPSRRWFHALPQHRGRVIAAGLLAGAAGAAGWLLTFEAQVAIVGALVVVAAAAALVSAGMRRPLAGVSLVVLVGVLAPIETERWTGTALSLAAGVVGVWVLRRLLVRRRLPFEVSNLVAATAALMMVAVVAFVAGQFTVFPLAAAPMSAQLAGLAIFVVSGGMLLVVAQEVVSEQQLRDLTWLFLGAGGLATVSMSVGTGEIGTRMLTVQTSASIGSVFYVWLVALAAGQALWNDSLPPARRQLLVALVALVFVYHLLLLTSWKSAWMPSLVALGTIMLFRFPRFTIGMSLVLVPVFLFQHATTVDALVQSEDYSLRTRLAAASVLFSLVAQSPWLGFGPANYHSYTPLFPILGYRVPFSSHNNYLDLAGQSGLLGLAAFLWILAAAAWVTLRLSRRCASGFEKGYLMGALGGVIGSAYAGMLGDWVLPFVYNVGIRGFRSSVLFWIFAGGIAAFARLQRQRTSSGSHFEGPAPAALGPWA